MSAAVEIRFDERALKPYIQAVGSAGILTVRPGITTEEIYAALDNFRVPGGIPLHVTSITFLGQSIPRGNMTLESLNIKNGDVLNMTAMPACCCCVTM